MVAAFSTGAAGAPPEGVLRASGGRIVDGQGREVLLRGMGLGGWMLQEGYMLGIKKEGTQHSIKARMTDLVGKDDTELFYRLWRQHHMTRADVDRLAASGFNSIRLPMHYNLFTPPIEEEPVKGKDTWLATGFDMTDSLLAWCRANRMYLILDLHAAPVRHPQRAELNLRGERQERAGGCLQPADLGPVQGDHLGHPRGGHDAPHLRRGQRLGQ